MGCNPNWSYITQAVMLMLQINHWRLVQTGLTGHCDVAFAFVFSLIILYKWTLRVFFHRFRFRQSLISVPSYWHPFYPSRSWTRAVWIRPWSKSVRKQSNRTLASNRAGADVISCFVLPHPPRLFLIPVSPITLELVNGSVFIYWRFSL